LATIAAPGASPRLVRPGDPDAAGPALECTTAENDPAPSSDGMAGVPAAPSSPETASHPPAAPYIRPTVTPLAADRYQIRFTATAETHQKLRQAQDLLGHSVPKGDLATVFDLALSALLSELGRKKLGATDRPRAPRPGSEGSRHIPARVRRAVWERDGGQCAFLAAGGRRCSGRRFVEFHHVHPYGAGGEATIGNIELRCRTHNAYEAELFYGTMGDGATEKGRTAGSSEKGQLAPGRVGAAHEAVGAPVTAR
jgi:hypothetical protein